MKLLIIVIACMIIGGAVGHEIGMWWLDRTVESPELESAVYPGIGTLGGSIVGLISGASIAWLSRGQDRE